jgi:hypothetical protein
VTPPSEPTKTSHHKASAAPPTSVVTATVAPVQTVAPTPTSSKSSDDGTPWGWIVLALVVVAAIVASVVVVISRRRRQRWDAWRRSVRPVLDEVHLSRDLHPAHGRDITDLAHWESVRGGAERAAADLKVAAGGAPSPEAAEAAQATAEALSGLTFALESDRLMQAAQPPPTATQLADADAAIQARRTDLDTSLARLDALVGAPPQNPGG